MRPVERRARELFVPLFRANAPGTGGDLPRRTCATSRLGRELVSRAAASTTGSPRRLGISTSGLHLGSTGRARAPAAGPGRCARPSGRGEPRCAAEHAPFGRVWLQVLPGPALGQRGARRADWGGCREWAVSRGLWHWDLGPCPPLWISRDPVASGFLWKWVQPQASGPVLLPRLWAAPKRAIPALLSLSLPHALKSHRAATLFASWEPHRPPIPSQGAESELCPNRGASGCLPCWRDERRWSPWVGWRHLAAGRQLPPRPGEHLVGLLVCFVSFLFRGVE